jgi:LPXTG-motif cell wall-anchored protein
MMLASSFTEMLQRASNIVGNVFNPKPQAQSNPQTVDAAGQAAMAAAAGRAAAEASAAAEAAGRAAAAREAAVVLAPTSRTPLYILGGAAVVGAIALFLRRRKRA